MKNVRYYSSFIVLLIFALQSAAQTVPGVVGNLNARFTINNATALNGEGTQYTFTGTFEDVLNYFFAADIRIGDMIADPTGILYKIDAITQKVDGINGVIVNVTYVSGSMWDLSVAIPYPNLSQIGSIFRPSSKNYPIVYSDPLATDGLKFSVLNNAVLAISNDMRTYTSGTTGSEPTSSKIGDMFYDTTLSKFKVSTGSQWKELDGSSSSGTITVSATEPTVGSSGDVYFNTGDNTFYKSNGTVWAAIAPTLADNSVTSAKIADGAVTTTEILNRTILGEDIGVGQVTTTEITDGTIQSVDIANSAVSVAQLKTAGVTDANMVYTTDASGVPTLVAKSTFGGSTTFDGNRTITRTGIAGVTGQNFNTADLSTFLEKVFFPLLSPYITSFRYNTNTTSGQYSYQTADADTKVVTDHLGTVTLPYSSWSGSTTLVFNYDLTKRDASSTITTVELVKGGSTIATNSGDLTTGSFTVNTADFANIDANQTVALTLKITYNTSNVVSLVLNTSFTKANGVAVSNVRLAATSSGSAITSEGAGNSSGDPYLIQRTGSAISNYLVWSLTGNDDAGHITNIYFSGSPSLTGLSGTNLANTYTYPVTMPHADATTVYQLGVSAKGSVANDVSAVSNTFYYKLQDKLYCGFVASSDVAPTSAQVTALSTSSLKTTSYYESDNGVTPTNATGSPGFLIFAVPTYADGASAAPSFPNRKVYIKAAGTWGVSGSLRVYYVTVTQGSTSTWYWIGIHPLSVNNGGSIQAKITD